jgi:hypothetical protein
MSEYLTPESPGAFDDLPILARPPMADTTIVCPKCKGHGGWNLRLNTYGPGKHFQASCNQCNGWGYVRPGRDAECIHEDKHLRNTGNCLNVYGCVKCGREIEIDSSD